MISLRALFPFSLDFFLHCLVKNEEIVSCEQDYYNSESNQITVDKRVNSIDHHTEQKEEMEKGKYPVEHSGSIELDVSY